MEQTAIGGVSGTIEVICSQPTVAAKNALQDDQLMSLIHEWHDMDEGVFQDLKEIFGHAVTYSDIHTMNEPDREKIGQYLLDRTIDW